MKHFEEDIELFLKSDNWLGCSSKNENECDDAIYHSQLVIPYKDVLHLIFKFITGMDAFSQNCSVPKKMRNLIL